jgi:hypothetical protein
VRAIANLTGELLRPKKLGGRTAARVETPLRRMPFFCTWRAISPKPQCANVMLMRGSIIAIRNGLKAPRARTYLHKSTCIRLESSTRTSAVQV